MKRLAIIAAVLLALVVTVSAVVEAYGEATSPAYANWQSNGRVTPARDRMSESHASMDGGSTPPAGTYSTEAQARTAVVGALVAAQRLRGVATFYCLPPRYPVCTNGYPAGSMVAAAGSELRVGDWRGSWVTVTHGERSVRVQLVDFCLCRGSRIIDLYGEPFSQLADTSAGVIQVQVTHGLATVAARPTPPATSTEGEP